MMNFARVRNQSLTAARNPVNPQTPPKLGYPALNTKGGDRKPFALKARGVEITEDGVHLAKKARR
jgi:hypothetical protein